MPLTSKQKYSIASTLSTDTLSNTIAHLEAFRCFMGDSLTDSAIEYAREIDAHYSKRNGFIPKEILKSISES